MKINEEQLELLAETLSKELNICIARDEVFTALFLLLADVYEIDWAGFLWDLEIDNGYAYNLLKTFDFNTVKNPIHAVDEDIADILLFETKVKVKAAGVVWYIHLYDADPFPSNPHAHNFQQNIKLDLSNGKCYRNKKLLKQLSPKALMRIRREAERVFKGELPALKYS